MSITFVIDEKQVGRTLTYKPEDNRYDVTVTIPGKTWAVSDPSLARALTDFHWARPLSEVEAEVIEEKGGYYCEEHDKHFEGEKQWKGHMLYHSRLDKREPARRRS